MASSADNCLRIGDYISLRYSKLNAFLSSDGVLVDDVGVSANVHQFENHVFQIVIQMQYSANSEYEEFVDSYYGDINDIQDFGTKQHFMALVRGKNNELKMNENFMKVKTGNKVMFGDCVQLLHVKSRKYLTVDSSEVARDERENMIVKLDSSGNTKSWLQLMPRYKIDREGDRINNNSEILLKVVEKVGEYIHCADKDPPLRHLREVNSSMDSVTPWRISLFQRSHEIADTSLLLTGDLVFLRDPETNTILMPIQHPINLKKTNISFETKENLAAIADAKKARAAAGSDAGSDARSDARSDAEEEEEEGEDDDDDISLNSVDDFIQEYGEVTLAPIVNEHYDSNAIWVLESKVLTKGGAVSFRQEQIFLRHLNTGRYLSTVNSNNMTSESVIMCLEDSPSDRYSVFSISELHSDKDYLQNSKAVQLRQGSHLHVERSLTFNDRLKVFICTCSRIKSKATNLIISRYDHVVMEGRKEKNAILDVYVGKSTIAHISKFLAMTEVPPADKKMKTITLWPSSTTSDRSLFLNIMRRIVYFVQGFPLNYDPETMSNLLPNAQLSSKRQTLLREQGLLVQLLYMLKFLEPVSQRAIARIDDSDANESAFLEMGKEVISETLKLMFEMIKGNSPNQMEVADFMLVILTHVSTDPLAAVVAQEMLSTNRDLQETKIGYKEIGMFAEKMRDSPMSSMYLNLLQSTCSCDFQGIPRNQQIIFEIVYKNYSDLVLKLKIDIDQQPLPVDWATSSTKYFPEPENSSQMKGDNLFNVGLPSLFLDWELYDNNQSKRVKVPELLYDRPIDISDTFRYMYVRQFDSKALLDYKKMVPEYFVSQIALASEMCLGRNYTVMLKFEVIYPYDCLVAIMKMPKLHDLIKGAAARLVTNLYVDRDPQNTVILPRLTRTWTEITEAINSSTGNIVSVDSTHLYSFGLLQSLISEHIESIRGEAFTDYSFSYMQLLLKLIQFNFYGSVARLKDIIDPLILALKRGGVSESSSVSLQSGTSFKNLNNKMLTRKKSKKDKAIKVSSDEDMDSKSNKLSGVEGVGSRTLELATSASSESSAKFDPKKYLDVLESLSFVSVIMFLCLVSIAFASYSIITKVSITMTGSFMWIYFIQLGIFILCAVDTVARLVLTTMHKKKLSSFIFDVVNILDIAVVVLDIMYFIDSSSLGKVGMFTKVLRALRIVSILQKKIVLSDVSEVVLKLISKPWEEPARYTKTSINSMQVMEKMVEVISAIQLNIEDRNISLLLNHFFKLDEAGSEFTPDEVVETFKDIFKDGEQSLQVSNDAYDQTYIDLLMYNNVNLVQRVLDVVMNHHSSRRLLLTNFTKLQLLVSSRSEAKYLKIEKIVMQLKHASETHAIWGKLVDESDRKTSQTMLKNLNELAEVCRKRREVLKFDEDFEPEKIIQDILRNLGCFELCMKIVSLISSIDKKVISESNQNTLKLANSCSELLYWFILDNPTNQFIAYEKIEFFIKIIDERINSHKIIKAIFSNNELLIKSVPKQYIADFVNMIVNIGRFPQYLSLLSAVTVAGDKNIKNNQYEVIRNFSFPGNQKKILLFFCPVTHELYARKSKDMSKYLSKKDISVDELPNDLQYHLELLTTLGKCSMGVSGMTTIEAKVQSMFFFVDLINAILDPQCLLLVKIKLGLFLYHSMIEVEMMLPSLKDSSVVWRFIESTLDIFEFGRDELRQIEKNGWEAPSSHRQKIEYVIVCAMVLTGYFKHYFDSSVFRSEVVQAAVGVTRVHIRETQANNMMKSIYDKVRLIYEMRSPLLPKEHHEILHNCLEAINNAATAKIVTNVDNLHSELFPAEVNSTNNERVTSEHKRFNTFLDVLLNNEDINASADAQIQDFITAMEKLPWKENNPTDDICFEALVERLFNHIRSCIKIVVHGDETIKHMDDRSIKTSFWLLKVFRTMIENSWGMSIYERDDDGGEEQDQASEKIVDCFTKCGAVATCLDLVARGIDQKLQAEAIKLIVGMLFHEGGALPVQESIYLHLNKPGSDLFFQHVRFLIQGLISWHKWNGVIMLPDGEDVSLPDDIILIRCLQLMAEGHYEPNQNIMRSQVNNLTNVNLLDDFVDYLKILDSIKCRTSTQAALAVSSLVLEMIQGPCRENQDYLATKTELIETLNRKMRHRPVNDCVKSEETELKVVVIDILQALMEGQAKRTTVYDRLLSVIHLDVLQLLCKPAEKSSRPPPDNSEEVAEEQWAAEDYEKKKENDESAAAAAAAAVEEEEEDEAAITLQTESLVVLQMLCDYKPALRAELGREMDLSAIVSEGNVVCCEVVWHGELQRKFIHVPDICKDLAKSTKDNFIQTVDRSSPENKIYGLLSASRDFHKEIKHQQVLKALGISSIFGRTNMVKADNFAFVLIFLVNLLFLIFYEVKFIPCEGRPKSDKSIVYDPNIVCLTHNPYSYSPYVSYDSVLGVCSGCSELFLNSEVTIGAMVLTILLVVVHFYKILIYFVVRVPVNFQVHSESKSFTMAVVETALDGQVLYLMIYFALALYGIFNHIVLTFLLLDIITKSSIVQGVLNAVYKPKKTIIMTIVLLLIILYILSMYAFTTYNDATNFIPDENGDFMLSLYDMVKEFLMHGSPAGSVARLVITISEWRYVADVLFFSLMFIMWNIIKGITIDTFVEIRTGFEAQVRDTTEKCFICGIEKLVFNRTLTRDSFDLHIKEDQNLWNYVYFIIYIWEQDKDDDDGLESYVRKCINNSDLAWFPMNKAIRLSEKLSRGDTDSLLYKVNDDLKMLNKKFESRIESFKENLSRSLSRVEYVMNPDNQQQTFTATRRTRSGHPSLTSAASIDDEVATLDSSNVVKVKGPMYTAFSLSILEIKGLILPADLLRRLTGRISSTTGEEFIVFPVKIDKKDVTEEEFRAAHKPFIDNLFNPKKQATASSLEMISDQESIVYFDTVADPFKVHRYNPEKDEIKGYIRIQILSSRLSSIAHSSSAVEEEEKIALFISCVFVPIQAIVDAARSGEAFHVNFTQSSTIVPELQHECKISLRSFEEVAKC